MFAEVVSNLVDGKPCVGNFLLCRCDSTQVVFVQAVEGIQEIFDVLYGTVTLTRVQ